MGTEVTSATMKRLLQMLWKVRKLEEQAVLAHLDEYPGELLGEIEALSGALPKSDYRREAAVLQDALEHFRAPTDFGGLGLENGAVLDTKQVAEVLFTVEAYLESLNSIDRARVFNAPLESRPHGRRGMTLSEKIFAAHDLEGKGEVAAGDMIRVGVDWIMASELSWHGMEKVHTEMGKPDVFRNDRFWLAGDHLVDPRVKQNPKIKALIDSSERAHRVFKMTEYQGMNYTIMHTEFCRERAQPGMLIVGSDSHTCSAGSVGSLAIGLGTADVTMPLVTGETWFRVPQSVCVKFINEPGIGIGGKDVILYILKELKRNTVAADRVVEFTGPGLKHLSVDARFAIANMTTEFGGVTGIFTPDEITQAFVEKRKILKHRNNSTFYRPDDDAEYAETHTIDLSKVEPSIARYPSPDDVVPISELQGIHLDGCFIGACTTTEEDLILAALVLEQGLKSGLKPVKRGTRKVVPGSMPILHKLRELGFADLYEQAGFEVGVPGCSYCVGMSADVAGESETWLSSQNRNFKNRMGKGSFGHITSAVVVAASSFGMEVTDPQKLIGSVDLKRFKSVLSAHAGSKPKTELKYIEPPSSAKNEIRADRSLEDEENNSSSSRHDPINGQGSALSRTSSLSSAIRGKIQILGDFINTDDIIPNDAITCSTTAEFGEHCLKYTHPNFRRLVREGNNVVVAGKAFGCGSSREVAVDALQGAGVQCIIAQSYSFIFGRNAPNLGLLAITMTDPEFYSVAVDGASISIDVDSTLIHVEDEGAHRRSFKFQLSPIERRLLDCGGISEAWRKWGRRIWDELVKAPKVKKGKVEDTMPEDSFATLNTKEKTTLQW